MTVADWEIQRKYQCDNKECGAVIECVQKATDSFLSECPFCFEDSLVMKEGKTKCEFMMDVNTPKTFGALAEYNTSRRHKYHDPDYGSKGPKKTPWWRKKKGKVDFSVLKNPKKYIEQGKF